MSEGGCDVAEIAEELSVALEQVRGILDDLEKK